MTLFHSKVRDPKQPSIADFLGLKRPFDADDAAVAGPSVEPASKKVEVYSYQVLGGSIPVALLRGRQESRVLQDKYAKYAKYTFSTEGWGESCFKYALQKNSGLAQHEQSSQHKESVSSHKYFMGTQKGIDSVLAEANAKTRVQGRFAMRSIFDLAKTMGRQGLAFRGHVNSDSNFQQFLGNLVRVHEAGL